MRRKSVPPKILSEENTLNHITPIFRESVLSHWLQQCSSPTGRNHNMFRKRLFRVQSPYGENFQLKFSFCTMTWGIIKSPRSRQRIATTLTLQTSIGDGDRFRSSGKFGSLHTIAINKKNVPNILLHFDFIPLVYTYFLRRRISLVLSYIFICCLL